MAADLIDQLTQDPDFLSLSTADQVAMYEELAGRQPQPPVSLNERIAARPSAIADLTRTPTTLRHPVGSVLRTLLGAAELYQGVPASVALDLQAGKPQQVLPNVLKVLTGQRPAQYGDVYQGAGVPAPVSSAGGLYTDTVLAPFGAKGLTEIPGTIKAGFQGGKYLLSKVFRSKPVLTNTELFNLSEAQVAKLPATLRADYVTLKTQVAKNALLPQFQQAEEALATKGQQAQEALQLKAIQQQQRLATQRLDFQAQAAKVEQARKMQVQSLGREVPSVARESLKDLSTKFRPLQKAHSDAYVSGMQDVLANAEAASGSPITFTQQQLDQAIATKYLRPSTAGTPPIFQEKNPQAYQELTNLLRQHGIVNQEEVSARQLLNIAKGESKQVGAAAKQLLRPYTPQEVAHQHLHDILLDLLKSHGVDVSAIDAEWAKWVPVRNLGLRLQTETGPSKLISIVRGRNPVAAEHLDSLQALLGERLDMPTRKVFEQLDSLSQQKVIEQAKAVEFERLMQSQQSVFRTGQLAEKSALRTSQRAEQIELAERQRIAQQKIGETAMEQKRRIDEMARHRDTIRKLVWLAAGGAAASVGGYGAYRTAKPALDILTGQQ